MPISKNERGGYFVRVQVGNRRVSRTVRTLKEAKEVEAKLKKQLHDIDHSQYLGRAPKCTFGQAAIKWGKSGAPKSMHSHTRNVLQYLANTQLTDTPKAAQNMKEVMLSQGLSNQTINRRLAVVRRVLNLCYREWGLLDEPLADRISLLTERNTARELYLEPHELDSLLDACQDPQAANMIRLAAYTGMRRGELFKASQKDFKLIDGKGAIRVSQTKSGKSRWVPVPRELWPVCNALPFTLTEWQLRTNFEQAREQIGRPDIRFHDLRHSYATWLISKGVDVAVVRDILGHSSLAVTSKYVQSIGVNIDEVFK